MNKKIELPVDVKFIIDKLWAAGYDSYIVGGCVRDSIIGREPNDWDITTEAEPDEIMKLFDKVILTGIKHGTVTVVINKNQYEVTTYRSDGIYEDGRHPKQVEFVKDLREDLARRDFTINAIAYNEKSGTVDYFDGISDLDKKLIRTVGEAEKRFSEDALRMLRAIRFSAQLNFNIHDDTFNAVRNLSSTITKVSKERIREEFNKIIINDPGKIEDLRSSYLLKYIMPEIESIYDFKLNSSDDIYDLYNHTLTSMKLIDPEIHLRLSMLFHNLGKVKTELADKDGRDYYNNEEISAEISERILKDLRYDNETIKKVAALVKYHHYKFEGRKSIKRILNKIGYDLVKDLIKIQRADILAQNDIYAKEAIINLMENEEELNKIINEKQCFRLRDLKINGKDLIEMGFTKGTEIGKTLDDILVKVIEEKIKNDEKELKKEAEVILQKKNK